MVENLEIQKKPYKKPRLIKTELRRPRTVDFKSQVSTLRLALETDPDLPKDIDNARKAYAIGAYLSLDEAIKALNIKS